MEILELGILTNSLTATRLFYKQRLGFHILEETDAYIIFQTGSSRLRFNLVENGKHPRYHFAFNIPFNKIDEAAEWLSGRTELILNDKNSVITNFENWKANAVYFYDNNENIVEFIVRADLNNFDNRHFSTNLILNINEVGLVAEYPLLLGAEITGKTNTEFFAKGPYREDFTAVGNDNGLFVISNPSRKWYPSQNIAEKWKVDVKVKIADKEYNLAFNNDCS